MASGSNIEPVIGKKYRFSYIGGRPYDPDRMEGTGVFVHKMTTPGSAAGATRDVYIFAQRFPGYRDIPEVYHLTYLSKNDIKAAQGDMNAGFRLDDLVEFINSGEFVHPRLDGYLTPYKQISTTEIDKMLLRKRQEKARQNIGSFMTHVIYHPPIKKTNSSGVETTVFTGGPMYKRGLAGFSLGAANASRAAGASGNKRKSRKQRGGLGQPLSYTDPSYKEPSADAGFNRQGIEPPYIVRPALNAIPMRGGAEQILSPMSFRDAYHSDPLAPTGQPVTDLKLPATLRQGLNFGRLSGGRRNTRRNTRRGGFYPSIMGGVVANAPLLAPLAARQGIHLFEEYRRTTRKRKSTRKSHRRRGSGRRA